MKTNVKALVIGSSGVGKTYFSGSFPKSYVITTEPSGAETYEMNPKLLKNIVKQDYFIPSPIHDVKQVFDDIQKACIEAHTLAKEGTVETLVLDNITYLAENRWIYINQYEREVTKNGELDTRGMYGKLGRWLYNFVLMNLCSFPGNVVVTSHVMIENEEAMSKKVSKDDIVANILGGFRHEAPGMFSLVMFLDKLHGTQPNQYKYVARVDLGQGKLAKNRYNLPEIIENISYQTVLDAIIKAKGETK